MPVFTNVEALRAFCQLAGQHWSALQAIRGNKVNAFKDFIEDFEKRITPLIKTCSAGQAEQWCRILELDPFRNWVEWENLRGHFKERIRDVGHNGYRADQWIAFIAARLDASNTGEDRDWARECLRGFCRPSERPSLSRVKAGFRVARRLLDDPGQELFDTLTQLQLPDGMEPYTRQAFREALFAIVETGDADSRDRAIRACLADAFELVKGDPTLFESWTETLHALSQRGVTVLEN